MRTLLVILALASASASAFSASKTGVRLDEHLTRVGPNDNVLIWVFFTDKGSSETLRDAVPTSVVSERSVQRRLKVRPPENVVDYSDLPVEASYVQHVSQHVLAVRQRSKWFNAVSAQATASQIQQLETLPFVREIELVTRLKKDYGVAESQENVISPTPLERTESLLDLDYGAALGQVQQINVPAVHNTGNYAQDVVIAVFDNGFRLLTHEAFENMNIIATYDFVDHKVSVVPNNPSTSFGSHGVNTLSTIGGNKPGQLIGPAFGASFILVRTENDSSETPVEEDYWLAGIEWADSIGVDVTSTSLGYLDYDSPYPSWTWQNMDGNTTVITRAADMAAERGIIVVNSAGNNGSNASRNTLGAPADGDSVIAVGAVNPSGTRSSFSSVGPTTSIPARIKPDVMAQGSSVRVASSTNPTGYTTSQGTSFSCPLAAGAAALILNAHPNATPMQVLGAMKATASNAASPNNQMGWGIINTLGAIDYLIANGVDESPETPHAYRLQQNYPNPFNPVTQIGFDLPETARIVLTVHDVLGRHVATVAEGTFEAGVHSIRFDASSLSSGIYLYRLTAGNFISDKKMVIVK